MVPGKAFRISVGRAAKHIHRPKVADTAKSIRKWRSFEFGDSQLVPFENAAKDLANSIIHEYMDPGEADKFMDSVHDALIADANCGIFVFNGTTYDHCPVDEVVSAFKDAVRDTKSRKAISFWMKLSVLCPQNLCGWIGFSGKLWYNTRRGKKTASDSLRHIRLQANSERGLLLRR